MFLKGTFTVQTAHRCIQWIVAILIAVVSILPTMPVNAGGEQPPVELRISTIQALPGEIVYVTLAVSGLAGRQFATIAGRMEIDSTGLNYMGATPGAVLGSNGGIELLPIDNNLNNMRLSIMAPGGQPVVQDGSVAVFKFKVAKNGNWKVELKDEALDEGNVPHTMIQGMINAKTVNVRVNATYADTDVPVDGIKVTLSRVTPIIGYTNLEGIVDLTAPYGNGFGLLVEKQGDTRGAVTAFDAALILRCYHGFPSLGYVGECYNGIADVSDDGHITPYDAWLTISCSMGYMYDSSACLWRFSPGNLPYPGVVNDISVHQYAYLMGDMTGSWLQPAVVAMASENNAVQITGSSSIITVTVQNPSLLGVNFTVVGAEVLETQGYGVDAAHIGNNVSLVMPKGEITSTMQVGVHISATIGSQISITNMLINETLIEGNAATLILPGNYQVFFPALNR